MAYGTLLVDGLQSSTAGTPPLFYDGNSTQVGTLCRAWVQFNGQTAVISASFNVSSITRSAVGVYQINYSTAMPDNKYAAISGGGTGAGGAINTSATFNSVLTTSCIMQAYTITGGGTTDPLVASFAVFR